MQPVSPEEECKGFCRVINVFSEGLLSTSRGLFINDKLLTDDDIVNKQEEEHWKLDPCKIHKTVLDFRTCVCNVLIKKKQVGNGTSDRKTLYTDPGAEISSGFEYTFFAESGIFAEFHDDRS